MTHKSRTEPHVSPSSLTVFLLGCQRRWGFNKILHLPDGETRFSDLGGDTHNVLENYTLKGIMPDLQTKPGQVAFPALAHIAPPFTPGVRAEHEIIWQVSDVEIVFKEDNEQLFADGSIRTVDYKTTSNLDYMKTPDDLLHKDPQGIIYAAHGFIEQRATRVDLAWLYLTTAKPHKCLPVLAQPVQADCLTQFERLLATSQVMLEHQARNTDPMALTPNPGHCGAFGRTCPYKPYCSDITPERIFEAKMTDTNASFMAAAFGAPASPTGMPGMPPAPAMPPAPNFPPAPVAWPQVGTAPVAPGFPPAMTAPVVPTAPAGDLPPWALRAPVAPPVAQVQTSPFPQVAQAPVAPTAPVAPAVQQPAPTVDAPKRTRRTKAEIQAASMPQAVQAAAQLVASAPDQDPQGPYHAPQTIPAPAEPDQHTYQFWQVLQCLAMNPAYAASPAVDVADRALALLVAGENAIGQS